MHDKHKPKKLNRKSDQIKKWMIVYNKLFLFIMSTVLQYPGVYNNESEKAFHIIVYII